LKYLILFLFFFSSIFSFASDEKKFALLRKKMVEEQILSRGMEDKKVLEAMERTPRHKFVPERYISQAYKDHPLPIGYGQTISQPYMVALMTHYLKLTGEVPPSGLKVLEIGTGSGYQAAILSELLKGKVYTIEIIEELGVSAARLLRALNYKNVEVKIGDGYFGWKEKAPFDRIIVTCAPDHLPAPLTEQLKEGGIMVIPVGPPGSYQTLWQIEKKEGKLIFNNMGGCIFVPFRRK